MNSTEKQTIERMDPHYRPIGAWSYFWLSILYALPIVGFIFLIIHACGGNINRRSYARSFFCILGIVAIILLIFFLIGGAGALGAFFSNLAKK